MQIAFKSDIGKNRSINQDYVNCFMNDAKQTLMIVCDGMGGHKAGDVASEMGVSHLGASWKNTSFRNSEELSRWFISSIQRVNDLIFQKSLDFSDLDGMGTTLVAAAVVGKELVIANIGDSRAYVYRNYRLRQITEDHSLVNEFIKSGEITVEEAQHHPRKNILTRSVGVTKKVDIDIMAMPILKGDVLLMCSDGLTNMLTDDEISQLLKEWMPLEEKAASLVDKANEAGGSDNITVLLADLTLREEDKLWK
ncbi:protein phosphatase 2c [Trichococcus palustris]|jgi:PPM family protein phosphatase|uniref:protein-serine/threonine phosphatase n=1 Tax=Trichococcus palustris TaxID=140314 RepID=A0A143Y668_9LACT|nr:Stp1/IreP family PP2C-type Ser/Thr phosphatase [Trichococcus palustris]CZQ82701.1 protein phosphatase 2c [Trichococcus palustris]SFK67977.1 protein phosphatase [Trichococcus palustris]